MFHFGQQEAFEGWLFQDYDTGHGQRNERLQSITFLNTKIVLNKLTTCKYVFKTNLSEKHLNFPDFNLFCQTLVLGKLVPTGFQQKAHSFYSKTHYEIFSKEHQVDIGMLFVSFTILHTSQKFTREVIYDFLDPIMKKKKKV